ncbi:MAG: serine protease [Candidatus Coproplasma sp.]
MKCSCCGEEVGAVKICPICGSEISASAPSSSYTNSATPRYDGKKMPETRESVNNSVIKEEPAEPIKSTNSILQQIADEKTRMVENCSKAVCIVYVPLNKTRASKGTGWCGYGDYIITNAHVVEAMAEGKGQGILCEFSEKLHLGGKALIDADLVYYNRTEDIAILLPENGKLPKGVTILKIDDTPTKQGEMVFTVGNPEHYKFTYTEGTVANPDYSRMNESAKYKILQTTLTLNHGNSGGPVMNAKGDVVGMATFGEINAETHKEIHGYGFCVKSEAILSAIKETEKNKRR